MVSIHCWSLVDHIELRIFLYISCRESFLLVECNYLVGRNDCLEDGNPSVHPRIFTPNKHKFLWCGWERVLPEGTGTFCSKHWFFRLVLVYMYIQQASAVARWTSFLRFEVLYVLKNARLMLPKLRIQKRIKLNKEALLESLELFPTI